MSKQRKIVTISVVLPVSVTVAVSREDGDDWGIDYVVRHSVEPTVRAIEENMGDVEFDDMQARAEESKVVP